jgi:energy-coupling factor transport system permease protein
LHPAAWWVWALGLLVAASWTTNPLLLGLVLGIAGYVVAVRRGEAPWARAFKYYLAFGLVVIGLRIVLRIIFGGNAGPSAHRIFTLPQVPLPHWAAGVQLGGPVTAEGVLAAGYDGLRLATLLCCVGAANALANPKRALRLLPGALYELGVAVVVAITVAPQLVDSAQRVRRARRLRAGDKRRMRVLRSVLMPVLQDALDRSLKLAAAMDSRGYGRRGGASTGQRRLTGALLVGGLLALCGGGYGLLGGGTSAVIVLPAMCSGTALCVAGLTFGGRRVRRSAYRPDPWRAPEWAVVGCGIGCAVIVILAGHYDVGGLNPSLSPLSWPSLPPLAAGGILLAGLAAFASPPPAARSGVNAVRPAAASAPVRAAAPTQEKTTALR